MYSKLLFDLNASNIKKKILTISFHDNKWEKNLNQVLELKDILLFLKHNWIMLQNLKIREKKCGEGEIRTHEGLCHWILSPAPIVLTHFGVKWRLTKLGNLSNALLLP